MKLLVLVLNKVEKLEKLLKEFATQGVSGATILNSTGMAHELMNRDDLNIIGSFKHLLNPNRSESKTLFMVVKEENLEKVINIIELVVGKLDEPDTGIMFTTSIDYVRGFKH